MAKPPRASRATNDLVSAGFFLFCAIAFLSFSGNLTVGTHVQPGARYLPLGISGLLAGLSVAIALPELTRRVRGNPFVLPRVRPMLAVLGIFVFAILIQPLGLIPAAAALVTLAFAAYGRIRLIELAVFATCLIVASILIFVVGLGQRIPLLP